MEVGIRGTIAEKLTYLDETREKIRKGINSIGGNLTNTDTFRSYSDALDGIYEKFPKVTGTGSNITLEDTMGASIKSELQGNTTQDGTPTPDSPIPINVVTGRQDIEVCGKNLFDKSKITEGKRIDNKGIPYTDENYSISDYIVVEPNTTYIRNLEPSVYQCVALYRSDKTFISRSTSYQYFTTSSDTYYIRFSMENDKVDTTQLEKGNQITTFEEYKGNSYEINLGKNLWNEDYANISTGIKYKPIYVGEGTFTMSSNIPQSSSGNSIFFLTGNVSSGASSSTNGVDKTISRTITSTNGYITIGYRGGDNFLDPTDYETQLEKGSQATSYSPYKTPIELCKIGNYKDFIKKGTGKNLLPYPYTQSTITQNGVTFTVNEDGTILVNGTASGGNASIKLLGNYQVDNQKTIPGKYLSGGTNTIRIRALHNENGNYTVLANDAGTGAEIDLSTYNTGYIEVTVYNGITVNNETIKPMVLNSLEDTTYEPYGMYNKWYIEKQIGKVVLNGSENWDLSTTKDLTQVFQSIVSNKLTTDDSSLNNYFIINNPGDTEKLAWGGNPRVELYIALYKTTASTVEEFKTWLSTHNTTVYYILNTPTYTEITDTELKTQLEEFEDAQSYEGQTNINVDGILPTILNVKALENIFN